MSFPNQTSQYDIKEVVGENTDSKTVHSICISNQQEVAIKILNFKNNPIQPQIFEHELSIWSRIHHINVVEFYTVIQNQPELWIVTEYMNRGSLESILKYLSKSSPPGLKDEILIASILFDVLKALSFIHEQHQFHLDLRTSNILLNDSGIVKVDDCGLSQTHLCGGSSNGSTLSMRSESSYMAPEVLKNQPYTEKSDIWGLGLAAYELAMGQNPYANCKFTDGLIQIMDRDSPKLPGNFSQEFCNFVNICLMQDPAKRPSANELLNHPFIKQAQGPQYIQSQLVSKVPPIHERITKSISISIDVNKSHKEEKIGRFTVMKSEPSNQNRIDNLVKEISDLKRIINGLESENEKMKEQLDQISAAIRNIQ